MIDSSHIKVHMHATGAKGGNQDIGSHKRRLNSKVRIVVDSKIIVINLKTTAGTTADCSVALDLIKKIKLDTLLGDRAYDTNSIINYAEKLGIKTVIPPKSKRKSKQNFDSALYHLHHIVENIFLKFKPLRGIATRYFKTSVALRASFFVRAISLSLASL